MFVYVFSVFSVSLYSSFNEHLTLSKTILHKVAIQSTNLHMQHFTKQMVNKKKQHLVQKNNLMQKCQKCHSCSQRELPEDHLGLQTPPNGGPHVVDGNHHVSLHADTQWENHLPLLDPVFPGDAC